MALNVPGLVSVIIFYLLILIIGIIAGRKTAKTSSRDEIILANRSMGLLVSFFTLTGMYRSSAIFYVGLLSVVLVVFAFC